MSTDTFFTEDFQLVEQPSRVYRTTGITLTRELIDWMKDSLVAAGWTQTDWFPVQGHHVGAAPPYSDGAVVEPKATVNATARYPYGFFSPGGLSFTGFTFYDAAKETPAGSSYVLNGKAIEIIWVEMGASADASFAAFLEKLNQTFSPPFSFAGGRQSGAWSYTTPEGISASIGTLDGWYSLTIGQVQPHPSALANDCYLTYRGWTGTVNAYSGWRLRSASYKGQYLEADLRMGWHGNVWVKIRSSLGGEAQAYIDGGAGGSMWDGWRGQVLGAYTGNHTLPYRFFGGPYQFLLTDASQTDRRGSASGSPGRLGSNSWLLSMPWTPDYEDGTILNACLSVDGAIKESLSWVGGTENASYSWHNPVKCGIETGLHNISNHRLWKSRAGLLGLRLAGPEALQTITGKPVLQNAYVQLANSATEAGVVVGKLWDSVVVSSLDADANGMMNGGKIWNRVGRNYNPLWPNETGCAWWMERVF